MTRPSSAPAGEPTVSRSVEIAADPHAVYALVTDLDVLAELGDEIARMEWKKGDGVAVGNVFAGANRNGWRRWTTRCTVTDATPGQVFAFDVQHSLAPVSHWRYEFAVAGSGCRVTESTWDRRPAWFRAPAQLATGVGDRTAASAAHIEATLARLKARAERGVRPA